MTPEQYYGIAGFLIEIRDRLPAPSAAPAVPAPIVITFPEQPPVGTKVEDVDGDTWERFARGWKVNDQEPYEAWSSVLRYVPLTVVTPDQPAAKSTDAILDNLRAAAADWLENDFGHVYGQTVLDILDGK